MRIFKILILMLVPFFLNQIGYSQAGNPNQNIENDYTLYRLLLAEYSRHGIDADMRRLLSDKVFENDVRLWWQAANLEYAAVASGTSTDNTFREAYSSQNASRMTEVAQASRAFDFLNRNRAQVEFRQAVVSNLISAIPSEKVRLYLGYFLRTGQREKAKNLLKIYLLEYAIHLGELAGDPRLQQSTNPSFRLAMQNAAARIVSAPNYSNPTQADGFFSRYRTCLGLHPTNPTQQSDCVLGNLFQQPARNFVACVDRFDPNNFNTVRSMSVCFSENVPLNNGSSGPWNDNTMFRSSGPAHVVSRTEFLYKNKVKYFTDNRHDRAFINFFENSIQFTQRRTAGDSGPLAQVGIESHSPVQTVPGNGSIDAFEAALRANASSVYPVGPVFPSADLHPAFIVNSPLSRDREIFSEMVSAIRSAKHTIYANVFFLGGTLGLAISREMVAKAQQGIKVIIQKDPMNAFDYANEIEPTYRYLKAMARLNPQYLTVIDSYVLAHRTGLPAYVDAAIPDDITNALWSRARDTVKSLPALYPKAKSDHSKVLMIDAAGLWRDSNPKVYIGSKNWTDSSGAMTFDETLRIEGPAAVAAQDDYYWDLWLALRHGSQGVAPKTPAQIDALLEDFDPLKRRYDLVNNRIVPTRDRLEKVLPEGVNPNDLKVVQLAHNNFDSSETSALDQDIQAIRGARRQIIINDQFLYEKRIVDELIEKANDPNIQIYVMLEPISHSSNQELEDFGGFPNTLYADLLLFRRVQLGPHGSIIGSERRPNIQMRWKKLPHHEHFHMEYHMKTITIDGFDSSGVRVTGAQDRIPPALITGSANKDLMTMRGSFREMQALVFDATPCQGRAPAFNCGAVAEADRIFWTRWNNTATVDEGEGSVPLDPFHFSIPAQVSQNIQRILGRPMTAPEFLFFMRDSIDTAYALEQNYCAE